MKKFIARILAVVFILGCIPSFGGITVQAADTYDMKASFGQNLYEGIGSNRPSLNTTSAGVPLDTVYVQFNLVRTNGVNIVNGNGGLTFAHLIDENTKMEITLRRQTATDNYLVYIDFYEHDGVIWQHVSNGNMEIYRYLSPGDGYIPIATFESQENNPVTNPNFAMYPHPMGGGGWYFEMIADMGLSFRYYGRTFHFVLSAAEATYETFQFTTDGLTEGMIYNYYVYNYTPTPGLPAAQVQVQTQIDTSTMDFIPFSEGKATETTLTTTTNDGVIGLRNDDPEFVYNFIPTDIPGVSPGLAIRFDEPMELKFAGSLNSNAGINGQPQQNEYTLPLQFLLQDIPGEYSVIGHNVINIEIDDLLDVRAGGSAVIDGNYGKIEGTTWTNNIDKTKSIIRPLPTIAGLPQRYEIRVYDVTASTLYSNVHAVLDVKSNVTNTVKRSIEARRWQSLPMGSAFSFLDYQFVFEDGELYIDIKPFEQYSGTYMVRINNFVEYSHTVSAGASVSIPIDKRYTARYQIYFVPESIGTDPPPPWLSEAIYSEKVVFTPDYSLWSIGSAKQFEIIDYNLQPLTYYNPGEYGIEGILDITARWRVGNAYDIQHMVDQANLSGTLPYTVVYNLNKSLEENTDNLEKFAEVKVHFTTDGTDYFIQYEYDLENPYDSSLNPYTSSWVLATDQGGYYYVVVPFENIHAKRKPEPPANPDTGIFYYENIYFINAETHPVNTNKISLFDSITLDDLIKGTVPPLRDLDHLRTSPNEPDNESFTATWKVPLAEIKKYIDSEADYDNQDFTVNLYISTSERKMVDLARLDTMDEREAAAIIHNISAVDADGARKNIAFDATTLAQLRDPDNILLIKDLEIYDLLNATDKAAFFTAVDNANAGGTYMNMNSRISGLDPNQTYYLYVTLVAKNAYMESGTPKEDILESMLSNLHGVVTSDDPDVPDGEDRRPPAPVLNVKDVGVDTATVYWDYTDQPADASESIYYQVIRTKGVQMDSLYMNLFEDLDKVYQTLSGEMTGVEMIFFQTDDNENADGRYSPYIFNGSTYQKTSADDYELLYGGLTLEFIDRTLSSNQIYFYHVRTVRELNGKFYYSIWNYTTCTTDTMAPPINLKIEQDASYDPESEFVFSFDAPIANIDQLGTEYEVEYQIRKDEGEYGEVITLDTATLKRNYSAAEMDGYIHFMYKISGLESGTQYAIRIRMSSMTSADKSTWTTPAMARTDSRQSDIDSNRNADAWMEFYKTQLELLFKEDYWTIQDSATNFGAVYRPTMFPQVIAKTADSQIPLPKGSYTEATTYTYYIPADSLALANGGSKGFILTLDQMEIVITPGTVSTETNETIFSIKEKIDDKTLKDYYLMILIEFRNLAEVNGQPAISKNMVLDFQLVGSKELTATWDNTILSAYLQMLADEGENATVRNRVITMYNRNDTPAEIESYIMGRVNDVKQRMVRSTYNSHRSNIRNNYVLDVLDKSIILAVTAAEQNISATGFKLVSGAWATIETFAYKSGKAMYANTPGSYVFAGVVIEIPGITGQPGAGTTYGIVAKYNLTDFLGVNGNIDTAAPASRGMLLNSAARMMGAPVGSDPVVFLKSKGYTTISGANLTSVATSQESVYVVMAVYEVKTGTKVQTIQIRNFNATAAITGMDERYKQSIRAAFELGIYTNAAMQPKAGISIKDLLDMLTALDARANL